MASYADECFYWVPSTPNGGDPRSEIAVMFDDRRRLGDRVYRLSTGFAWSQAPSSRTVRLVSNVEVFDCSDADQKLVRSNFMINEFWDDETRILAGWAGHRFRKYRWQVEDFCQAGQSASVRSMHPQSQHHPVSVLGTPSCLIWAHHRTNLRRQAH